MRDVMRWLGGALGLLVLVGPLSSQERLEVPAELKVRLVGGALVTRVRLDAGPGRSVEANLVVDLGAPLDLVLHGRTARLLGLRGGSAIDVVAGGTRLEGLAVVARRLQDLEFLTMEYARELQEIPAVGYLGLPAFADARLELDITNGRLRLLPPAPPVVPGVPEPGGAGTEPKDSVTLPLERHDGVLRLPVVFGDGSDGAATLDTSGFDSWCTRFHDDLLSGERARLPRVLLGSVNVTDFVPLRTGARGEDRPGGGQVVLGNGFLSHFRLELDPANSRCVLQQVKEAAFPEEDLLAIRALSAIDFPVLEEFLAKHADHRLAAEVATRLLEMRVNEHPRDMDAVRHALELRIEAAPPKRRARVALALLGSLKTDVPFVFDEVRESVLKLALNAAEADDDKTALPKIRSEIGEILLEAGRLKEAYRHLLSAAFQLPRDGRVNERLGRLYEKRGKWERAWARFLQAAITDDAGSEGIAGLKRIARAHDLKTPFDVDQMERALEGRVPAYEPAGTYVPPKDAPTSRRVLVELFTSAHARSAAAPALALDGAAAFFGGRIVLLEHHLHAGGIDPMSCEAAMERARECEVRGLPLVLLDGSVPLAVNGRPEKAASTWLEIRKAVARRLETETPWKLDVDATLKGRRLDVEVRAQGPRWPGLTLRVYLAERSVLYPGASKIVFHRYVSRADLADGGAVLSKEAGLRTFKTSVDLGDVEDALEEMIDAVEEESGQEASMRTTPIAEKQVVIVAFIEDLNGKVLQAARHEISPREDVK